MTTAYTSLLGLALPVQGELSGTWGDMVDNAITSPLDVAVAGTQSITGDSNVTLTVTNGNSSATNLAQVGSGTTGSAQYAIINCTGARTAARTITVPASSRIYTVINATTGGFAVNVVGAGPTTGISVANGEKCSIAWNGTDYVKVATTTAGTGTVTAVSVVSANGLAGTSSGGATPALTLSTSITGVLKGNATAISAAVAGTDYVTPTGTETLTNKTLTNPTVTNYVETPFSANSSTAITLALTNGTVQIITLTGNATITMPTATSGKSFIIFLKQDATGSRTVTWSTVKWPGGTAPTITSTASRQDIFSFFADGTNWYGVTVSQNYTP